VGWEPWLRFKTLNKFNASLESDFVFLLPNEEPSYERIAMQKGPSYKANNAQSVIFYYTNGRNSANHAGPISAAGWTVQKEANDRCNSIYI